MWEECGKRGRGVVMTSANRVTTESRKNQRVRHEVFFQHWPGQNTASQDKHPVHWANILLAEGEFFTWGSHHVMKIHPLGNPISLAWVLYSSSNLLILIWFFDGFLTRREGANGIQSVKWLCVFFPCDSPMDFLALGILFQTVFSLRHDSIFLQQKYNPLEQRDWVNNRLLSTCSVLGPVQGSKAKCSWDMICAPVMTNFLAVLSQQSQQLPLWLRMWASEPNRWNWISGANIFGVCDHEQVM